MAGADRYQNVSNQILGTKNCSEIVIALKPIYTKWDVLGNHLDVPGLDEIAASHGDNHFRKMSDLISKWLRRPTPDHHPSWRVLCVALAAMEEIELADKIAGIDNQSQPASDSSVSGASSSVPHVVPSVSDLDEQLHDLADWELFATHLPEIDQHDITKIANDFHGRTDRQKLQLYKIWLDKCTSPSWDHVIGALKKIRNNRLVDKIENWLKTKRGQATSRHGEPQPMPTTLSPSPPLSTTPHTDALAHTCAVESTDNGSEGVWDMPPDDNDTSPFTLDAGYEPTEGEIAWHTNPSTDSALGGDDQPASHLVVVITNEYKGSTKGRLLGIDQDRQQLYKTFGGKRFKLLKLKDTSKQKMESSLLPMVAEAIKQRGSEQYESAFIIFSGHGGMTSHNNSYILSEKIERVNLEKLIDGLEKKIGDAIPKFFLINACRKISKNVPLGTRVNTLHAYSTKEGNLAYMNTITGSFWIQELARDFRQKNNANKAVVKIIEKVNLKVAKKKNQEPVIEINTLNAKGKDLHLTMDNDSSDEEDERLPNKRRGRDQGNQSQGVPDTPTDGHDNKDKIDGTSKGNRVSQWYYPSYSYIMFICGILMAAGFFGGVQKWNWLSLNGDNPPEDKELLFILSSIPVTTKLQTFCINLGLPSEKCSEIFDDPTIRGDFDAQRHGMLRLWSNEKTRTWEDFVKALDHTGYRQKAREIAAEHNINFQ